MYYKRLFEQNLSRALKSFPCVVLSGARQVGKTFLLKTMFPKYGYVSLDLPSLAEQAENNPEEFLKKYPAPLIVDEMQYAPKLFRYLKIKIDQNRHSMGQYILTGSQKFSLMKEVSESLAGRAAVLELETFSILEIPKEKTWSSLICRGLYPELWRNPELNSSDFYSSYLATYLERDVRQILNVGSLRDFERLLRSCASRSAQILNYSEIARDVGIKPETAREWISVLMASNQIFLLEPYYENFGKRIVKSPKVYIHDPGLLCFLLGLDEQSLEKSPLVGVVWETFVYAELRKQLRSNPRNPSQLWFYRDGQGNEIDFLLSGGAEFELMECKWTENPDDRWSKSLLQLGKDLNRSKTHQTAHWKIICRQSLPLKNSFGVTVCNPYSMLEKSGF